jgi:hypothetical protein
VSACEHPELGTGPTGASARRQRSTRRSGGAPAAFPGSVRHLAILAAVLLTVAAGPTAAARAQSLTVASPSAPGSACTLTSNGAAVITAPTGTATRATFKAALNTRAAAGLYRISLTCPPRAPVTRLVHVRPSTRAHAGTALIRFVRFYLAWGPPLPSGPIRPTNPTLPVIAHLQLSAAALAVADRAWSAGGGPDLVAGILQSGQCTALAAQMRPDIIPSVTKAIIAGSWMANPLVPAPKLNWDAKNWDVNAAAAGMEVGAAPRVGAIMVFHPSPLTAPAGHVAYVTAVHADGTVSVVEEHSPDLGRVTHRDVIPREMSGQDIDFIY